MSKKKEASLQAMIDEKDHEIAQLKTAIKAQQTMHERVLSETRWHYENILAVMPGHVYWLNKDNIYLGCNNIQAKQANLISREEIVGKRNADLPWHDQAATLDEFNRQVMATGIASERIETATMLNGDGVYFSQKVPLYNEQQEVNGVLGVSIDITELMKKEAALILAKKRAEESNRSKTEFIANMSHDVRTPLTGMLGLSKLLSDELGHPEYRQYAAWIHESTAQLLRLLNEILDVASAEQQTPRLVKEMFDLRQCVAEIEVLERPAMMLKQLDFKVDLDEDIPNYIVTDRIKLYRILLNLIGNGIKFTQKGFVLFKVKVVDKEADRLHLEFSISDSGIGIPVEYQAKVFERFFKTTASYGGVYTGSGVGLNIARSYVEKLGGELTLTSQPDQGTTFRFNIWIDIPTPEMESSNIENTSLAELTPTQDVSTTIHPLHILLVEDNVIALNMAELLVKQAGCYSTSVATAEDALDLLQTNQFDLIISDVGLPGLSGIELTTKIREIENEQQKQRTPIIGLTAHVDQQGKQSCLEAGMDGVFSKPMTLNGLRAKIDSLFSVGPRKQSQPSADALRREKQLLNLSRFPLIDLEYAIEYSGGEATLRDLLVGFVQERLPDDLREIKEAYTKKDWNLIRRLAHRIRGSAVYVGAFRMQYAAEYLETYDNITNFAFLKLLYAQLVQAMLATKEVALVYLNSEKNLPSPDFIKANSRVTRKDDL